MGTLSASAGGANKDRILDINNFADPQFDINVTISNLTMQAGNAPHFSVGGGNFYHTPGGAIQYDGINNQTGQPTGTLTLTTVKITGNTADGQGGGVFGLDDTLVVQTNSLVTLNSSTLGAGGGISYGGGNFVTTQAFNVTSSTIGGVGAGNSAPDNTFGNGAGASSVGGAASTISNSTIANNVGNNLGGGIAWANTAGIAVSNTTFSSNTAKNNGGAIYNSARNAVTNAASTNSMTTVTITGNTADSDANNTGNGGGIFNLFGLLTVQTNSIINSNNAVNGGGIFSTWTGNTNDASASLTLNGGNVGQTGSGNIAKGNGVA
jgi:predicted outer membrane repeat protein